MILRRASNIIQLACASRWLTLHLQGSSPAMQWPWRLPQDRCDCMLDLDLIASWPVTSLITFLRLANAYSACSCSPVWCMQVSRRSLLATATASLLRRLQHASGCLAPGGGVFEHPEPHQAPQTHSRAAVDRIQWLNIDTGQHIIIARLDRIGLAHSDYRQCLNVALQTDQADQVFNSIASEIESAKPVRDEHHLILDWPGHP